MAIRFNALFDSFDWYSLCYPVFLAVILFFYLFCADVTLYRDALCYLLLP